VPESVSTGDKLGDSVHAPATEARARFAACPILAADNKRQDEVTKLIHRTLRSLLAIVVLAMMVGCGGDDSSGADNSNDSSGSSESSSDVGGGVGHWTASELCSLSDPDAVAGLFPDANVVEIPGLDSADSSACVYMDAGLDPLSPESNLATIGQRDYEGTGFSDAAEPREVTGADEAVFFADFDGSDASYIVTVGDQLLSVEFEIGTAGGDDFAESIVGAWVTAQSAG